MRVLREFGERRDSRTVIQLVEDDDGRRFVLKRASDPEAIGWLESAVRFHAAVQHPAIARVLDVVREPDAITLVEEYAPGQVLRDVFDPAVLPREHPDSPYQRLLRLPSDEIAAAVATIMDAHVAVAAAGFVAVDLHDGCVVYDFDAKRVRLIDLDHYCPGPYVLDVDRQFGSTALMPPEEFQRGATIDQRTTVFTVGRMALVYLGCAREAPPDPADFRGTRAQYAAATAATQPDPADRIATVDDLAAAWAAAST